MPSREGSAPTEVVARLRLKDGQWKVYDLLVQRLREKTVVAPVMALPRSGG